MTEFIFSDGERIVERAGVSLDQAAMFDRLQSAIGKAAELIACPEHKVNSHLAFRLNVGDANFSWQIVDFCCNDFKHLFESVVPEPWKHAQSKNP